MNLKEPQIFWNVPSSKLKLWIQKFFVPVHKFKERAFILETSDSDNIAHPVSVQARPGLCDDHLVAGSYFYFIQEERPRLDLMSEI